MEDFSIPAVLQPYVPLLKGAVLAIVILVLGWIVSKWLNRLTRGAFRARKLDAALGGFLASLFQYTLLAAAVITALGAVGIQTTSLVAVFASAGIAVGLALQDSLASFASGVMILFFRPFDIDHRITAAAHTGVVKEIGLFATTLLTADNEEILIPNKAVAGGSIVNSSARGTLRGGVPISVAFGADIDQVSAVLLEAAKKTKGVLADPAPSVSLDNIKKTVDLTLYVWATTADQGPVLNSLRRAVYDGIRAAHIPMPANEVTVHQASG